MVDAFHKSTELINLTITIYMVMQGLCERYVLRVNVSLQHLSRLVSTHGLGNLVGPLGTQTDVHWLHDYARCILRRFGFSADFGVLAPHASPLFASFRVSEHRSARYAVV